MAVTIIFGGQYGSEGKGKVAHFFAGKEHAKYCIRVGGTNSGHTIYKGNQKHIYRILPTGVIKQNVNAVLPAGSYIDLSILMEEIKLSGISDKRLFIDENAVIITTSCIQSESKAKLRQTIGSTGSGTGAAVIERIQRKSDKILAKNCKSLKKYIVDTKNLLRKACDKQDNIIIEGTQGYGLSLLHAKEYPYVTSRDTSAAGFLSETGLSPFDVKNIVMVIRSFPIRVSGNSGPMKNEIDWDTLREESKNPKILDEFTSCTNRIRRIARFDEDIVLRSIKCNNPNIIVLNHVDYFPNYKTKYKDIIRNIQTKINREINYIGTNCRSVIEM